MLCLLRRERAARLITDGPGAAVKRRPQDEGLDETVKR